MSRVGLSNRPAAGPPWRPLTPPRTRDLPTPRRLAAPESGPAPGQRTPASAALGSYAVSRVGRVRARKREREAAGTQTREETAHRGASVASGSAGGWWGQRSVQMRPVAAVGTAQRSGGGHSPALHLPPNAASPPVARPRRSVNRLERRPAHLSHPERLEPILERPRLGRAAKGRHLLPAPHDGAGGGAQQPQQRGELLGA